MALTDDELFDLMVELEEGLREDAEAALSLTATEFADAVGRSTELVAAAFSVSRIGAMWRRRVGGLMQTIRRISRRGSAEAAAGLDEPMPPVADLDRHVEPYLAEVRERLDGVGDRLAEAATQALSEGVAAGETHAQLQQRLRDVFADSGAQLGEGRAARIARTEATAAFNAGAFAAALELTGDERPLVKQWIARRDDRTRQAHRDADGQLQLLEDPFDVGGFEMRFPGDPLGPADQTINCRCILKTATASATASAEGGDMPDETLSAAAGAHPGAMVALVPREADAARLALDGGEPVGELHLTLRYLGEAADWSEQQRASLLEAAQRAASWLTPLRTRAFGVAQWNPGGDKPAWVYNVGDVNEDADAHSLQDAHFELSYQMGDHDFPHVQQHTPWSPHVRAVYSTDDYREAMTGRTGDVTFDRLRVAFAGEVVDFPLLETPEPEYEPEPAYLDDEEDMPVDSNPPVVDWYTPDDAALAYENQQTGDGRIFAPEALFWDGEGPWPLQYADEMKGGHDGAQLAGAIHGMGRFGDRIVGNGVLYLTQSAGLDAALLLAQNAPLGVSVDLDDVDVEFVDANPVETAPGVYRTRLAAASVLALPEGGWSVTGETAQTVSASGSNPAVSSSRVTLFVSAEGKVSRDAVALTAAAGDPDRPEGVVIDSQRAGDFLMRITRGRVRGATLVTMPAYANARIVLADTAMFAAATEEEVTAAIRSSTDYDRILRHVRSSRVPVGAARVAQRLKMPVSAAQRLLAQAASRGEVVRLCRGLYTDKTTSAAADHVMYDDLAAAVTGAVDLPVADRDHKWDGPAAKGRVFDWADGDTSKLSKAFAYRDDEKDPETKAAYKLGYADVVDGTLTIIPAGVSAAIGAVNGARGGVDIPAEELSKVADHLERVRAHVSESTGESAMDDMQASAWAAMGDLPAMPANWFREPTEAELPPGGPGVNYSGGRIFGWVAQAGEPHAGFAKKITIDGLGRIDTSHFLRQRFTLDDGSSVKAGAYTMNVGHHRDGAECETSACQFDDTRTVAGIVTVGMNARGMWFSGAAAPWLSEWDRQIFAATQPSYHMKKGPGGNWQLRAVLGVPVPGHSSPLLASAVIERAQVALTAAATMVEVEEAVAAEVAHQAAEQAAPEAPVAPDVSSLAELVAAAVDAALDKREARKAAEAAELAELVAMAGTLDVDTTGPEGA